MLYRAVPKPILDGPRVVARVGQGEAAYPENVRIKSNDFPVGPNKEHLSQAGPSPSIMLNAALVLEVDPDYYVRSRWRSKDLMARV